MNLQLLFGLTVILAAAFGEPSGGCEGPVFKVNGVNYKRERLKWIMEAKSLCYDRSTNDLFLTHYPDSYTGSMILWIGAKMNLDTNELETIDGVTKVDKVSVDAKTNKVYMQARGGIYKYDKNSNRGEIYVTTQSLTSNNTKARNAYMLFAKDDIVYFAATPPWAVYKIVNGEVSKFKDLETTRVRSLVIDDNNNIFYVNISGLYRQKVGSQEAVYYQNSKYLANYGFEYALLVTIDNAGAIYAFSDPSGIYAVSKNTNEMEKVLDAPAVGLTFDGDNNIIYADAGSLYRFKPNNDSKCV